MNKRIEWLESLIPKGVDINEKFRFTKCYVILKYESKHYKGKFVEIKQDPSQLVKI